MCPLISAQESLSFSEIRKKETKKKNKKVSDLHNNKIELEKLS